MLNLSNITFRIEGRILFDNIDLQLDPGQKAALIGRNGSGKSTLFKIILGEIEADNGKVSTSSRLNIASVSQEVPNTNETPLKFLLNSDKKYCELFELVETATDPQEIADAYEELLAIDAYTAESRASVILKGLGFSDEMQQRSVTDFSGGFRMRIALATALFLKPDLLLLDEPTNHLDLESIIWLEEYLKNYSGSLIIISHEREFLNKIVDNVFHLKGNKVTKYRGNYDIFEEKYQQKLMGDLAFNKRIEAQKAHMQKFVDKFRYKATKAKQAQSRLKAISKLNPISILDDDKSFKINFPEIDKLASPIITFEKANIGYDQNIILNKLGGSVTSDDRIAILGANGQGKSTFCKMLAKELKPLSGKLEIQNKLSVGYFNQHQYEILQLDITPIEYLRDKMVGSNDFQIRTHLGCFGITQDKANIMIGKLSGGEKARLVFAVITLKKPQILILDEPTNHLDIEMRESLIIALNEYEGAIILISHDVHLIENTVDKLWIIENKTISNFDGSINDYKLKILQNK